MLSPKWCPFCLGLNVLNHFITLLMNWISFWIVIPPPNEVGGGVYWIHLVRPSVCPSVCRRHGFRSISQVCFGISISNFICMLMVAIGRSLLIFSDVTFKMAAWRPYWIFWFPDSNFTLALNINFKLQRHNTYVYGLEPFDFIITTSFSKWPPGGHIGFFGFQTLTLVWLWISTPNLSGTIIMYMYRSLWIFSNVNFKMAARQPYWIFWFPD